MKHCEFRIGGEFITPGKGFASECRWRCTDIGTRSITAIRIDHLDISTMIGGKSKHRHLTQPEAEAEGWFNGPPYAVGETVFDEDDQIDCAAC
jgi:hypothetical protein